MFQGYNDIPRPITKEVVGQRMDGEREREERVKEREEGMESERRRRG